VARVSGRVVPDVKGLLQAARNPVQALAYGDEQVGTGPRSSQRTCMAPIRSVHEALAFCQPLIRDMDRHGSLLMGGARCWRKSQERPGPRTVAHVFPVSVSLDCRKSKHFMSRKRSLGPCMHPLVIADDMGSPGGNAHKPGPTRGLRWVPGPELLSTGGGAGKNLGTAAFRKRRSGLCTCSRRSAMRHA